MLLGICLDAYLLARVSLTNRLLSLLLSLFLFSLLATLWFLLPRLAAKA